jgi:hypothetical protein
MLVKQGPFLIFLSLLIRRSICAGIASYLDELRSPSKFLELLINRRVDENEESAGFSAENSVSLRSAQSGFAYFQFFDKSNCEGSLSYSSGISSNICFPSSSSIHPPSAYDFSYIDLPFLSFIVRGITGFCLRVLSNISMKKRV